MRHIPLRVFSALLAVATLLATLPTASADPACPNGDLYEKSARGLMPPVCVPAEDAPQIAELPTLPFLAAPISTQVGSWAQVVAAADLRGDGRALAALLTAQNFDPANDTQLHLFRQDETRLGRVQQLPAGAAPEALAALDVNLDGTRDLVAALAGDNALAVYTNTLNPPTLSGPAVLPVAGAPNALALADVSGDLRPDLAVVTPQANRIRLWQSTPSGLAAMATALPYASASYDAVASGDLNNDGYDDLVAVRGAGYRTDSVVVYLQQAGTFPVSITLSPELGGYLPQSLAVGDLNGDGLDDLVVTAGGNQPNAYLNVFLQGPSGLAPTPITYPAYHLPSAVAIADITHDGREDVIAANDGWRTVSIFTQTSSGTLNPYAVATVPYSSRYRPDALDVADLNGDGGLDLALVSRTPGLTVLNNTQGAPIAAISAPASYATVPAGTHTVTGTTSPGTTAVQVRVRGLSDWTAATLTDTSWSATVNLPATNPTRSWWIEARASDAAGRVQAPLARVRVRATGRVRDGLLVEYPFEEQAGTTVHDTAALGTPLDLTLADEQAVSRVPHGLFVHTPTRIASPQPAIGVTSALKGAQAFTLEAWIRTANLTQEGPARILTLSDDSQHLNVSLIQSRFDTGSARIGLRLSTSTPPAGKPWYESVAALPLTTDLTHVMVTRDVSGTLIFYLNGVEQGRHQTPGDLSSWSDTYKLLVANDAAADRPWLGEYHLAAIYQRALTANEVLQNYAAGPLGDGSPAQLTDAQLVYRFNDGSGTTVSDSALVLPLLPAQIADSTKVQWGTDSLTITAPTIIATDAAATKVTRASMATGEVSIEAWLAPATTSQRGPARIVSIGKNSGLGDLFLAQGLWGTQRADRYVAQVRDDAHDDDRPYLSSPPGTLTPALTYVVYTRDAAGIARLYVNGTEQANAKGKGDLSSWDASYRVALANVLTMNRAWLGSYQYLAISSRALSAAQIAARFQAGPEGNAPQPPATTVGLFVQQVVVNGGADSTPSRTIGLDVGVQVPAGQSLDHLTIAEYGFDPKQDVWRVLQRGTLASAATGGYSWTLKPGAGIRYLQVWATDRAGTTSSYPYQASINFIPDRITIDQKETHVYRFALSTGESLTAQVAVVDGDPDLYVWGPAGDSTMRWVSNGRKQSEQVNFTAPVNGEYQVEVCGHTDAAYNLTITRSASASLALDAPLAPEVAEDKELPRVPAIALESEPALTTPPRTRLFVPLAIR